MQNPHRTISVVILTLSFLLVAHHANAAGTSIKKLSLVGTLNIEGDTVAISGKYAFVNARSEGIRTVSIANPAKPQVVATYTNGLDCPAGGNNSPKILTVRGHYLYGLGQGTLYIFDISTPTKLVLVGLYGPDTCSHTAVQGFPGTSDIGFSGNTAYIAGQNGLYIYDVSDPSNLVALGVIPTAKGLYARNLAIHDGYVYLAAEQAGTPQRHGTVYIVDVRDPRKPKVVSRYQSTGPVSDVRIQSHFLLIADRSITVLDIANPKKPVFLRQRTLGRTVFGFLSTSDPTLALFWVFGGFPTHLIGIDTSRADFPQTKPGINILGYRSTSNAQYVITVEDIFRVYAVNK